MTCITDGRFLTLFYINTAENHDFAVLKENIDDFTEKLDNNLIIGDKGYVSKEFTEKLMKIGIIFITIIINIKTEEENTTKNSPAEK